MGGVAVLHPQDVLNNQRRFNPPMKIRRSNTNPRPIPDSNPAKSNRRKRSPQKNTSGNVKKSDMLSSSPPSQKVKAANNNSNLVMGQVKILKRGEPLAPEKKNLKPVVVDDMVVLSAADKLGPEPDTFSKHIGDFYAGSAFISSPPPSSLPVPAFFKKEVPVAAPDDVATTGLIRLLKLDLH